jgi:hypothetical protein
MNPTMTEFPLTPSNFLKQRVDDQITWHDNQAKRGRRWNTGLAIASAVLLGLVTFLTRFPSLGDITAAVSILAGIVGSIAAHGQYRERWVQYRRITEALRSERIFFTTRQGNYSDAASDFGYGAFVVKVESILNQGIEDFSRRASATKDTTKADAT